VTRRKSWLNAELANLPISKKINPRRPAEIPHSYFFGELTVEMAASVSAPATFKQPSRKGKKAWRKNVDVTDISKGLEEVREQIIQG
jgi:hypothetical protein